MTLPELDGKHALRVVDAEAENICGLCLSYSLDFRSPPDSDLCRKTQISRGCHACGYTKCWTGRRNCVARLGETEIHGGLSWLRARSDRTHHRPVSDKLQTYVARKFAVHAPLQEPYIRAVECGAGGDCLFYSIAVALGRMVQAGGLPARHILCQEPLTTLTLNTFSQGAGRERAMEAMRRLSAGTIRLATGNVLGSCEKFSALPDGTRRRGRMELE